MEPKLVIDIGGTYTKYALYKNNKIIFQDYLKTIKTNKLYNFLENIIEKLMKKYKIKKFKGIGISAPSPLSCEKLTLISPPNILKIKNLNLSKLKKFTKKLILENDGNCAALGAQILYKRKNIVCLTLGTGFGCGLIVNGKLYKGKGNGSEFGNTIINGKNTLEDYISSKGLVKLAKKNKLNVNCIELNKLAFKGNKKAIKVYKEYGKILSTGLVNIANTLDPELIVITGGLSNASKFFIKEAKKGKYFGCIKPEIKVNPNNLALIGALKLL